MESTDLRDLDDTASKHDAQSQSLGERIFETLSMRDIEIVN